jgi:hypothetical protein
MWIDLEDDGAGQKPVHEANEYVHKTVWGEFFGCSYWSSITATLHEV